MSLADFKDINEQTMANTLLHLALNHTGLDNLSSRIAFHTFEVNKLGDLNQIPKNLNDKQCQMHWQAGQLQRAFRENYSHLNWLKVFEAFGDLDKEIQHFRESGMNLDEKAYSTLLQIFNESKPQNTHVDISLLLDRTWKSPSLQLSFISNAIQHYQSGEDKTFSFAKTARKISPVPDVSLGAEATQEVIDIWSSPEVIEKLAALSETAQYSKVRKLFNLPLRVVPEYLLLTISKCKFEDEGHFLIDELLSILMRQFLQNNNNTIPVLKKLWDYNQELLIRGICEICNNELKHTNLSRAIDISQEIKDSLIKIVYCQSYEFAVKIGILAGKREYLHFDVWLKERIKGVGTPFIKALLDYLNQNVIIPCREHMIKHGHVGVNAKQLSPEEQ